MKQEPTDIQAAIKVSVVVPCYNQELYLGETLKSVLDQTYPHWECIIVDDGSTDNSADIANEFVEKDSRFSYYYKSNSGPSAAKNLAISKATGKYIFPFDGDDIIDRSYFQKAVSIMEKDISVEVVHCNVMQFGNIEGPLELWDYSYTNLLIKNFIIGCAFFRHETFAKTTGFCEEMIALEDWDIWLKLLKSGGSVYKIDEFLYKYRRHKSGSLVNKFSSNADLYNQNLNRLYKNHVDVFIASHGNPILLYKQNMILNSFHQKIINNLFYRIYKLPYIIKKWRK